MVHHKHYPNLGSDTSTMQNFCASSSGVISPGQPVVGYLHPLVFGMEMALLPSLQYIYSSVFTYLQFVRSKFEQIHFFVQWPDGCEVGRAGGTIAWGPRESLLADCERGRPSFLRNYEMFYGRASALVPLAPHSCSRPSVTQKKNKRLLAVYQVYGSAPGYSEPSALISVRELVAFLTDFNFYCKHLHGDQSLEKVIFLFVKHVELNSKSRSYFCIVWIVSIRICIYVTASNSRD